MGIDGIIERNLERLQAIDMRWYLFFKIAGTIFVGIALWFGYLMFDNGLQASQWKKSGDRQQATIHRTKSIYCTLGFAVFFVPGIIFLLQEKPKT